MLCRTFVVVSVTLTGMYSNYKQAYGDNIDPNKGGNLSRWGTVASGGEVINGFRDVVLEYFEGLNQYFIKNII